MPLDVLLIALLALTTGLGTGALIGVAWSHRRGGPAAAGQGHADHSAHQAVVRDSLDRLHDQLRDLEGQRIAWQSQLRQHVDDVRHSTDSLRRETAGLSTALRRPQVRGAWGELHLRRAVELAGMVEHCDFSEQVTLHSDDGPSRPDLVVRLAGGRQVAVDAKVPLEAYLDAAAAATEEEHTTALARHARLLRDHVDRLARKGYWKRLDDTPEFVVLFVPAESFLSAALESDRSLIEHAAARGVVLATPTTLIALLRTVAHAWTQESVADRAREIHALGRELHERLSSMGGHLDRLGRSLTTAVGSYNAAVGSLESRVLVSARRLGTAGAYGEGPPPPTVVDQGTRSLSAAELLDAVAVTRDELPDLAASGTTADLPRARSRSHDPPAGRRPA